MSVRIGKDGTIIRTDPQQNTRETGGQYSSAGQYTARYTPAPARTQRPGITLKWVICLICTIFFDPVFQGVHRIFRGRIIIGLIWIFTNGLFGIGWVIDVISMLIKKDITFLA